MKLHLGCGHTRKSGFINIDIKESKITDRIMDVKNLDYEDNSVDEIYTSNMIEHMNKEDGLQCLKECHRVLKYKGILNIEFPGLDLVMKSYVEHKNRGIDVDEVIINAIYGLQRHPSDYHNYGYTLNTMKKLLENIGFNVFQVERGRTGYPDNTVGWKFWATKK